MRTYFTRRIATVLALSTAVIFTSNAAEQPLELSGKTVVVYPVVLGEPGQPVAEDDPREMGVRIAEVIGLMIEEMGMVPSISEEDPRIITTEGELAQMEEKIRAFADGEERESDYALFARLLMDRKSGGPGMSSVCAVLTDARGEIVWSEDCAQSEEGAPHHPMEACQRIALGLLSVSDLVEPDEDNAPHGAMAEQMRRRSGVPPQKEIDVMEERFDTARSSLGQATLTIYPFRVWGEEAGSTEGAQALAEKLNEVGLFQLATVAEVDTGLKMERNPNQMKILWDTARMFRAYLKEHSAETDYALLVDVTLPAHHLHLILCDGSGEWVMVDLQNSHHQDFNEINAQTVEDAATLALRRMKKRVED